MTHVRQVTGTIHKPDGSPWPEFAIGFDVPKTAATTHATLPGTSVGASTTAHTIVTQTNASGEFAVNLEVDVTIRVTMLGALVTAGTSTRYPGESQFVIVVPDGDTPISLETIRAAEITPPDDPTLPNLVAQVASDLSDHEGDTDNPHEVTAAQVDTYTTGEIDNLINDHRPEWGNIDGDLADQTDLASALGAKADATDLTAHTSRQDNPHGVTAAQAGTYTSGEIDNALSGKADTGAVPTELTDLDTSVTGTELDALKQAADGHGDIVTHDAAEFATAAQGEKADTAVQPADIADFETSTQLDNRDTANRARANHTGTQAISTVSGLQDALEALDEQSVPEGGDAGRILTADGDGGTHWREMGRGHPHFSRLGTAGQYISTRTHGLGGQDSTSKTLRDDRIYITLFNNPYDALYGTMQVNVTTPSASGVIRAAIYDFVSTTRDSDANQFSLVTDLGVVPSTESGWAAWSELEDVIHRGWRAIALWASEDVVIDGVDGNTFGVAQENSGTLQYTTAAHDVPYTGTWPDPLQADNFGQSPAHIRFRPPFPQTEVYRW